jgi:hypothetical protein
MKFSEWKNIFIKDNVLRDIYATCGNVKALETFVEITIANEGTLF